MGNSESAPVVAAPAALCPSSSAAAAASPASSSSSTALSRTRAMASPDEDVSEGSSAADVEAVAGAAAAAEGGGDESEKDAKDGEGKKRGERRLVAAPSREDKLLFHAAEEAYRQTREKARHEAAMGAGSPERVAHGGRGGTSDKLDSKLEFIYFGNHQVYTWYSSPYPSEYAQQDRIWVCEFCLQYFKTEGLLTRHMAKPHSVHPPHPPGDEIYRKGNLSVWEVDGKKRKIYCQNLCLLAKLFLDTKTLYYDVEPFLFYVLTEWDDYGAHFAGYFSKEKQSFLNYNLSCIMVLPQHQRKGYGRALIDFSYLLTRKEGKVGTPEKPLSDLGLISYRAYWKDVILHYLEKHNTDSKVSIARMSEQTGINTYDIISTLQSLGMVKYWRGKHVLVPQADVDAEHRKRSRRRGIAADPAALRWTPLILKES